MKVLIGILVFVFGILIVIGLQAKSMEEYEKLGYQDGYKKAYNEVFNDYESKLSKQTVSFENELKKMDELYASRIEKAEQDGLYKGKQDKLKEVNEVIDRKAKEAKVKKNWNDILFEVQ